MSEIPRIQLVSSLPSLPNRKDDSHKGDFGRALVIAGSRGMSGAACLAGAGALRGGAGLVTMAVPHCILNIIASFEPSYMTIGLPDDDHGRILQTAIQPLTQILSKQSAVAIGPGLGQSNGLLDLVVELYRTIHVPCVFDADALNLLAKRSYLLKRPVETAPRIITPHVLEFSRISGIPVEAIEADRTGTAAEFAQKNHVVVVLKGCNTVVTDGTHVAINTTGNSGMATGGSGDVLTGVIAGLLAQGLPVFEAAHLGVHVHGLAGDLAAEELSKPGMIASDLPRFIGRAWCELGQ